MCIRDREKGVAEFFKELTKHTKNYKGAANLIINKINPWLNEEKVAIENFPIDFKQLGAFIQLIEEGKVSNTIAYQRIFPALFETKKSPLAIAESMNLVQSSDTDFLAQLVDEVLAKNPDKVKAYQKGKKGLIGFFMGQVMKASKGKAAPKTTNALLIKKLQA